MKALILIVCLSSIFGTASVCANNSGNEEPGLGATCWSRPFTAASWDSNTNLCYSVPETQFPGINLIAARQNMIEECRRRNALDDGCNSGNCCYPQCDSATFCVYLTPNRRDPDRRQRKTALSGNAYSPGGASGMNSFSQP